jgi:hypothetical protein
MCIFTDDVDDDDEEVSGAAVARRRTDEVEHAAAATADGRADVEATSVRRSDMRAATMSWREARTIVRDRARAKVPKAAGASVEACRGMEGDGRRAGEGRRRGRRRRSCRRGGRPFTKSIVALILHSQSSL